MVIKAALRVRRAAGWSRDQGGNGQRDQDPWTDAQGPAA
jgi:hypothetical protein